MANKNNSPCFGCFNRRVGCHSGCDRFQEWSTEHVAAREAVRQKKQQNNMLRSYSIDLADKIRMAKQ